MGLAPPPLPPASFLCSPAMHGKRRGAPSAFPTPKPRGQGLGGRRRLVDAGVARGSTGWPSCGAPWRSVPPAVGAIGFADQPSPPARAGTGWGDGCAGVLHRGASPRDGELGSPAEDVGGGEGSQSPLPWWGTRKRLTTTSPYRRQGSTGGRGATITPSVRQSTLFKRLAHGWQWRRSPDLPPLGLGRGDHTGARKRVQGRQGLRG